MTSKLMTIFTSLKSTDIYGAIFLSLTYNIKEDNEKIRRICI